MSNLTLDWDADVQGEVVLHPLKGYKCYETHRWERFDLPVWSSLGDADEEHDGVRVADVCRLLAKRLPKLDKVIEYDWGSPREHPLENVEGFGFGRAFAAVVHFSGAHATRDDPELDHIDFWLHPRSHESRDLWLSVIRDLSSMPLLVESHCVGAQCLINDHRNVERIWDALVEYGSELEHDPDAHKGRGHAA